jgi:hypothetical protein
MTAPLNVKRNDYNKNKKSSVVYTPPGVAQFLHEILYCKVWAGPSLDPPTVLDPAIGGGALTDPWFESGATILGVDINPFFMVNADTMLVKDYLEVQAGELPKPDIVLMNPPFNQGAGRKLFPEVFLRKTFELFGTDIAVAMITPMGCRLNQRKKSKRWPWLRDCGARLTSIVSLPLDIFEGVQFHCEVLIFNVPGVEAHYFLPDWAVK